MRSGFPRRSPAGLVLGVALGLAVAGAGRPCPAAAEDYKEALQHLLADHKRAAAARADLSGAHSAASQARAAWYPDLSLSASLGHQSMAYTNGTTDTNLDTHGLTFGLRQTLWDFGATNAGIDKADIGIRQSEASLAQVVQDLILEGLTAYVNLDRARRTLDFAHQSVANIAKQTGMEESLVQLGGGFTSDVLQAKSQLAGAQARVSRAQGQLANAINRYRAVFGHAPNDDEPTKRVPVVFELLPPSLDAAVAFSLTHNRQLEVLRLTAEGSHAELDRVRANQLYPKIAAVAQRLQERNPDGIIGGRTQEIVKVEMTYQFNTGLGGFHAVDVADSAALSADNKYAELRDLVEEQVRDAWQNLESARDNARFLDNQVNISNEFLRLARQERLEGRRSLIDVLSGETSLINAQSDAASADADVAIAAFTLFRATGLLDLSVVP